MQDKVSYQFPYSSCQLSDRPKTGNHKPRTENQQTGFSVIELVIAIGLLGLLVFSIILAMNPLERAKEDLDIKLENLSSQLLSSVTQFYIAEGRFPWTDDLGGNSPFVTLPWTSVLSSEVGICGNQECSEHGELITTNILHPGVLNNITNGVNYDGLYPKISAVANLYIATSKESKDPIYVCYLPQSEKVRKATGKLYRIQPGTQIPPSGSPQECPLFVSWEGDDVCYACVSK